MNTTIKQETMKAKKGGRTYHLDLTYNSKSNKYFVKVSSPWSDGHIELDGVTYLSPGVYSIPKKVIERAKQMIEEVIKKEVK